MNAPTDLWLVRHGHALHHETGQLQWDGVPLSEEGRAQAGRLAERFRTLTGVAALYTSPQRRAWDTAVPIAAALGLAPIPCPGLREVDFGLAGGLTIAEFRERYPEAYRQWENRDDDSFRFPGGETRAEFYHRAVETMAALVRAHAGERIVVVGHTGTLCCYLAYLFVGDAARWPDFRLRPASVTRLEVGPDGARFLLRDDVSHL